MKITPSIATSQGARIVRLSDLSGETLRQLASLRDSAPARRQARADYALRRQLVRLASTMQDSQREAIEAALEEAHPLVVLEAYLDCFLEAMDKRQLLPFSERGGLYRPCDVLPSDDEADSVSIELTVAA